jgi:hypothetical protein
VPFGFQSIANKMEDSQFPNSINVSQWALVTFFVLANTLASSAC